MSEPSTADAPRRPAALPDGAAARASRCSSQGPEEALPADPGHPLQADDRPRPRRRRRRPDPAPRRDLGLVGESGCGKSTVSKLLVALEKPTAGSILYKGQDVAKMAGRALKQYRREVQIIFQDPYASLNPRMTVGDIVAEGWSVHADIAPRKGPAQAHPGAAGPRRPQPRLRQPLPAPVLRRAAAAHRHRPGAGPAAGGHRLRRAGVGARRVGPGAGGQPARGPAGRLRPVLPLHRPRPVGGPAHLRPRRGDVPRQHRRGGHATRRSTATPSHPYTQALLSSVPLHEPRLRGQKDRILLQGDVPSPANPPSGCRFRTRCWKAQDICATEAPALVDRGQGHPSACHFAEARDGRAGRRRGVRLTGGSGRIAA